MTMAQHLKMRSADEICRMAAMLRWENLTRQGVDDPPPWMTLTDAEKLPWLLAAHGSRKAASDVMVWEYPIPLLPGLLCDEDGDYPDHTPYLGFDDAGVVLVRCGGATIQTMHHAFDDLKQWAEHVCGVEVERLRAIIIDREVADYKRERGLK